MNELTELKLLRLIKKIDWNNVILWVARDCKDYEKNCDMLIEFKNIIKNEVK